MDLPRWASVSVDLDTLPHYARIHGLPESLLDADARALVYRVALPRLLTLFEQVGVPVTLFVIGEDVAAPAAAQILKAAHAQGAELANHTQRHLYGLAAEPPETVEQEVAQCETALEELTGQRPVGFRAPGYAVSSTLLQILAQRGYRYDSSVFPAVPYYLAKAGVMAAMRLLGRRSGARLDHPAVLVAPREPYSPSAERPYRRGRLPLLELPISVTPRLRLPFFGTGVTLAPTDVSRVLYESLDPEPFLNLELHAIDLLEGSDGIPEPLLRRQLGLSTPVSVKRARLAEVLGWMKRDRRCVTLRDAAAALEPQYGRGE